jgi:hypothetical protein
MDTAPSAPFEVSIIAGETTEANYGAEYTSTLQIRLRDRGDLWHLKATLLQDGREIQAGGSLSIGAGDEYYTLRFEAEGMLTVRVEREGYEPVEQQFEVKRGKTATVTLDMKRKQ